MTAPRGLHAGDRVRLRPGDRPRLYLFGRGMDEFGEALFTRGQTDLTFAGQAFAVREAGKALVLYDGEDAELLAHEPRRRGDDRLGDLAFALPGKKPGRLGTVAELRVQNGIVVAEIQAPTPPLPVLFALVTVVWRTGMANTRETKSDWHVRAGDSVGATFGAG